MDWVSHLLNDPERKAKAAQFQEDMREKLGSKVNLHPAQIKLIHGGQRETQIRATLELFQEEHKEAYATRSLTDEQLSFIEEQINALAESFSLQGKFEDAALVCFDEQSKAEYRKRADAVKSLNRKRCACPDTKTIPSPTSARGQKVSTVQVLEEFWIDRVIQITKCLTCNVLSARTV